MTGRPHSRSRLAVYFCHLRQVSASSKTVAGRLFGAFAVLLSVVLLAHAPAGAQDGAADQAAALAGPQAPALIAALDRTVLSSELTGPLAALEKRPGERFSESDVLARLSCRAYEAQRDVGKADVESAAAQLAVKKRLFELQSAGALEVEVAEAAFRRARAEVRLYQVQVDRCVVRAPYDGRVVDWRARPYASIEVGGELMEIVGVARLEVEVIVPSPWLKWIKVGTSFLLRAQETGRAVEAEVVSLGAVVDPASQTVVIRGLLDGAMEGLLPGMSARAYFKAEDAS